MIYREQYIEKLLHFKNKNVIKVITGIRRCGKSTLFEIFKEQLLKKDVEDTHIISINLEDGDFRAIKTADDLYDYVMNKVQDNQIHYVFLDEVQQVTDFQKAVDWLYVKKNIDLYITGSNAYLLSGELATYLSGRYVEIKMMPLSFSEYCSYYKDNANLPELFRNYLSNSSFPGTLELERKQDIRSYLEGIYNTILLKDIVTRKKIADPSMLISVIDFIFDNIGNLCSTTKISNMMCSAGRKISVPTVESYLLGLEDSFIVYKIGRYDVKGKQYLSTGAKYYVADIGLRYFLLGSKQTDYGHILENVVFLELLRRGYEVYIGKVGDAEVDFVATNDEGTEYYQVSQTVLDENTLKRELSSLESIHDHNPKYLLTMDYVPPVSYNGIKQLNILDWLTK